jgi:hypothetical protein
LSFRDLLITAVHSNGTLSAAQKLRYLEAQVKGEPALLIQSIAITDANCGEAWKLLNERYHDRRELVNDTFRQLFALQPLQ